MSSQQKRGFRLPWAADRASDGGEAGAATLDAESPDATSDVAQDDLGEGPFRLAGGPPPPTEDPGPAASNQPAETAEATMIESQTAPDDAAAEHSPDAGAVAAVTDAAPAAEAPDAAPGGGWPDADRRTTPQHADDAVTFVRPPIEAAASEPRVPRRDNPLVAGLVKAMREAAVASRDETMTRLQAEAEARTEGIRARATGEAAELRKRADADVAEIREWSKEEIARIRQQTDDRVEARKTELEAETERHAASVERLVDEVHGVVTTFESDMERFFERLLAEDDPARLAALAEQAPEPPDLSGDGPTALDLLDEPVGAPAEGGLEAHDAAAAEVAATEGLDLGGGSEWPAAVLAATARPEPEPSAPAGEGGDGGSTRLLVTGLTSVAGISAMKGALGQLPGVTAVSVSSGERGVFVFAIDHEPGLDLATGVAQLPGFDARIMDASDDGITVVAHEPAA